jgi:hypothetical protein
MFFVAAELSRRNFRIELVWDESGADLRIASRRANSRLATAALEVDRHFRGGLHQSSVPRHLFVPTRNRARSARSWVTREL